jgi:hypothetical protein
MIVESSNEIPPALPVLIEEVKDTLLEAIAKEKRGSCNITRLCGCLRRANPLQEGVAGWVPRDSRRLSVVLRSGVFAIHFGWTEARAGTPWIVGP